MKVPERATDSVTVTTTQEAGNEGRRPLTECSPTASKGEKYRTLGRIGIEDGDMPLDDERPTGL
jgi:hypothetical protein